MVKDLRYLGHRQALLEGRGVYRPRASGSFRHSKGAHRVPGPSPAACAEGTSVIVGAIEAPDRKWSSAWCTIDAPVDLQLPAQVGDGIDERFGRRLDLVTGAVHVIRIKPVTPRPVNPSGRNRCCAASSRDGRGVAARRGRRILPVAAVPDQNGPMQGTLTVDGSGSEATVVLVTRAMASRRTPFWLDLDGLDEESTQLPRRHTGSPSARRRGRGALRAATGDRRVRRIHLLRRPRREGPRASPPPLHSSC